MINYDNYIGQIMGEKVNNDLKILKDEKRKEKYVVKDVGVKPIIKVEDDYVSGPHPNLLSMPFSLLIIAPKGSGKTVLLHNLLIWYYKMFDLVLIFSPTIFIDIKWRKLVEQLDIDEEQLFERYIDAELTNIMEKIKNFNEGKDKNKEKVRVLILFDDIIEQLPRGLKECALNKLAFNHRHYNISHIILSQSFKKIDCNIRTNTTGIILFNTDNSNERFKITEELCGNIGKKKFAELYYQCVKEKYNFMFLNYDTRKVFHNFSKQVGDLNQRPELGFVEGYSTSTKSIKKDESEDTFEYKDKDNKKKTYNSVSGTHK
jgi:hypothetical protein